MRLYIQIWDHVEARHPKEDQRYTICSRGGSFLIEDCRVLNGCWLVEIAPGEFLTVDFDLFPSYSEQ